MRPKEQLFLERDPWCWNPRFGPKSWTDSTVVCLTSKVHISCSDQSGRQQQMTWFQFRLDFISHTSESLYQRLFRLLNGWRWQKRLLKSKGAFAHWIGLMLIKLWHHWDDPAPTPSKESSRGLIQWICFRLDSTLLRSEKLCFSYLMLVARLSKTTRRSQKDV